MVRFVTYLSSVLAALAPRLATALSGAAEASARNTAAAFLRALHAQDAQRAMRYAAVPFLGREQQLLETEDKVLKYLHVRIADSAGSGLPDTICGVFPYENSREIADAAVLNLSDNILKAGDFVFGIGYGTSLCGYLLVRSNVAESKVVGMEYEPVQSGFRA